MKVAAGADSPQPESTHFLLRPSLNKVTCAVVEEPAMKLFSSSFAVTAAVVLLATVASRP